MKGLVSHATVYPLYWLRLADDTIVIAEPHPGRDRARDLGTIAYRLESVTPWVRRQPYATTLLICYEAGSTGFGLAL